jgi:hypothetical protein
MKNQSTQSGPLWLLSGGRHLLEKNAIGLLRHADTCGSITNAAKAAGISYKTAMEKRYLTLNDGSIAEKAFDKINVVHGEI